VIDLSRWQVFSTTTAIEWRIPRPPCGPVPLRDGDAAAGSRAGFQVHIRITASASDPSTLDTSAGAMRLFPASIHLPMSGNLELGHGADSDVVIRCVHVRGRNSSFAQVDDGAIRIPPSSVRRVHCLRSDTEYTLHHQFCWECGNTGWSTSTTGRTVGPKLIQLQSPVQSVPVMS
jgi:hypothetical protein